MRTRWSHALRLVLLSSLAGTVQAQEAEPAVTQQQPLVAAESCPQVVLILGDGNTLGGRQLEVSDDLLLLERCDGSSQHLTPEEVRDIFALGPQGTLVPSQPSPPTPQTTGALTASRLALIHNS